MWALWRRFLAIRRQRKRKRRGYLILAEDAPAGRHGY